MSKLAHSLDRLAVAAHNLRLDAILAAYPIIRTLTIPREPDFVIGQKDAPYMRRWWVIPRNRFFNIYLHNVCRDDDDRALHDHPWWSISVILLGGYWEHTPKGKFLRQEGSIHFRKATAAHRLELRRGAPGSIAEWEHSNGYNTSGKPIAVIPAWTIFITGPKVREWGFHCPKGWMHWRDFIGVKEGEARGDEVNKGCGE